MSCFCCEDSDDEDSTSFSYGFTDDPEDDVYIPVPMKDYLPKEYDPLEEYYKNYQTLIQEDQRWGTQPEQISFTDMGDDTLLNSARSLLSETELSPRTNRGINLFIFLICNEKDYEKRKSIIQEYEKARMKIELVSNSDFQEVSYCLLDARNESLDVHDRIHAFHKALFNCVVKTQQREVMREYTEYCESVKKK